MKKEYEITKTRNGFIIIFKHEDKYYSDENTRVALTLQQIIRILKEDVEKPLKTETVMEAIEDLPIDTPI